MYDCLISGIGKVQLGYHEDQCSTAAKRHFRYIYIYLTLLFTNS